MEVVALIFAGLCAILVVRRIAVFFADRKLNRPGPHNNWQKHRPKGSSGWGENWSGGGTEGSGGGGGD